MGKKAFALREDRKESFSDASITLGGGRSLRVAELLKKGKGVIVTEDPREQEVLGRVDALKEVKPGAQKVAAKATVQDLRDALDARGIDHSAAKNKKDLQKLIKESDDAAGSAGGEE